MPKYKFVFEVEGWSANERADVESSVLDYPNPLFKGDSVLVFERVYYIKDIIHNLQGGFGIVRVNYKVYGEHEKFNDGLERVKNFVKSFEEILKGC